jgi:L-lactate dehydrogenase (cytochrome)
MWPRIEMMLAQAANDMKIPFCLSTVATETPEGIASLLSPSSGWFQLYVPPDMPTTMKILQRASDAGFKQLLITVDIPQASRRQRTRRAGLTMPPKMNAQLIWDGITHPHWLMGTLKNGLPRLRTVENYSTFRMTVEAFQKKQNGSNLSWEYAQQIKDVWDGPVILKGIMSKSDALRAIDTGFDGIVVSNHGGRQFDAAPSSIYVLPEIASAVNGQIPIMFDGGIRTGLDIIRAIALGADFVLAGRAFIYSVCALQHLGPYHAYKILFEEMENNMRQLGISSMNEIKKLNAIIDSENS